MNPSSRYFLHRDGRDHGPFSRPELEFLWSEGRASGGDFVRPENGEGGLLLRELVASHRENPEPADPGRIEGPDDEDEPEGMDSVRLWDDPPAVSEIRGTTAPGPGRRDEPRHHREGSSPDLHDDHDQEPLYRGHPSLLVYSGRLFWVAVFAAMAVWLERFGDVYVLAAAVTAALILISVLLHRASCLYQITALRIEASHGLLLAHSRELAVADIRSIEIHRSGLSGLLNIGTIEFASSGSDRIEVVFRKVRAPGRIKKLVHELQDQAAAW